MHCAFFLSFIIVRTLWNIWKEYFQFHRNNCKIGNVSKKYAVLLIYGQLWFNLRGTEAQSELTPNIIQMERSGKGWSLCTSADINERSEKGLPQDRGFMYASKTTLIPNAFDLYRFLWRTKDRNSRYSSFCSLIMVKYLWKWKHRKEPRKKKAEKLTSKYLLYSCFSAG